jgi:hypothetical protein
MAVAVAAVQAQVQGKAARARAVDGLNPFQRAYLDTLTTLAGWRVAQDREVQVTHWAYVGDASQADVAEARALTKKAHRAYSSARARYTRLSTLVAIQAGTLAGSRAAAVYLGHSSGTR